MKAQVITIPNAIITLLTLALGAYGCYCILSSLTCPSQGHILLGNINEVENTIEFTCPKGESFNLLLGAHSDEHFGKCRGIVRICKDNNPVKVFYFDVNASTHANWLNQHGLESRIINSIKSSDYGYKEVIDLDDVLAPRMKYQIKVILEEMPSGKVDLWLSYLH